MPADATTQRNNNDSQSDTGQASATPTQHTNFTTSQNDAQMNETLRLPSLQLQQFPPQELSGKGSSNWLTVLPGQEHRFALHKTAFYDAIALRYGWDPARLPDHFPCGVKFSIRSTAFPALKVDSQPLYTHNEIRNLTASLLTEVCHEVQVEPTLQPLSGESFNHATLNKEDGALTIINNPAPPASQNQPMIPTSGTTVTSSSQSTANFNLLPQSTASSQAHPYQQQLMNLLLRATPGGTQLSQSQVPQSQVTFTTQTPLATQSQLAVPISGVIPTSTASLYLNYQLVTKKIDFLKPQVTDHRSGHLLVVPAR